MTGYEKYQDKAGKWRWRFFAPNGEQISKSSQGHDRKEDCNESIRLNRSSQAAGEVTTR